MNDKLALAKQLQNQLDPYVPDSFDRAMAIAAGVAKSRLFGITSPEAAFVIMATGHDLGLSEMQSLRGIHIIEGKPSPSADAIVAIVLRSGLADYFREVETTDDHSTWETKRRGSDKPARYTYTIKEAQEAGLIKPNGNWQKYRKRMLSARAKAFLGRDVYPDILLGMVTIEELQGAQYMPANDMVGEVVEPAPESSEHPVVQSNPIEEIEIAIRSASLDDLPALANRLREGCPKGHPERARMAALLSARKDALQLVDPPMREMGDEP